MFHPQTRRLGGLVILLLTICAAFPHLSSAQEEPRDTAPLTPQAEIASLLAVAFDRTVSSASRQQALSRLAPRLGRPKSVSQLASMGWSEANLRKLAGKFADLMLLILGPHSTLGPPSTVDADLATSALRLFVIINWEFGGADDPRRRFFQWVYEATADRQNWPVYGQVLDTLVRHLEPGAPEVDFLEGAAIGILHRRLLEGPHALLHGLIMQQDTAVDPTAIKYLTKAARNRATEEMARRVIGRLLEVDGTVMIERSPMMAIATRGQHPAARAWVLSMMGSLIANERAADQSGVQLPSATAPFYERVKAFERSLFTIDPVCSPYVTLAHDDALDPEIRRLVLREFMRALERRSHPAKPDAALSHAQLAEAVRVAVGLFELWRRQTGTHEGRLFHLLQDESAPDTLRTVIFRLLVNIAQLASDHGAHLVDFGLSRGDKLRLDGAIDLVEHLFATTDGDRFQDFLVRLIERSGSDPSEAVGLLESVAAIAQSPFYTSEARDGATWVFAAACKRPALGSRQSVAEWLVNYPGEAEPRLGLSVLLQIAVRWWVPGSDAAQNTLHSMRRSGRLNDVATQLGEDDPVIRAVRAALVRNFRQAEPHRVLLRNVVLAARILAVTRDSQHGDGLQGEMDDGDLLSLRGMLIASLRQAMPALYHTDRQVIRSTLGKWFPAALLGSQESGEPRLFSAIDGFHQSGQTNLINYAHFAAVLAERFPHLQTSGLLESYAASGLQLPQLRLTSKGRALLPAIVKGR